MRNCTVPAIIVVAAATLFGCTEKMPVDIPGVTGPKLTDEEKIERILDDVHQGMQAHRTSKVLSHVSKDYLDEEGRDYEALKVYLNTLFKSFREITITRVRPRIIVEGDSAQALETFGTMAKPHNAGTEPAIDVHGQVWVHFERAGNTWLIVKWGRLR
jgi:hypothetical protein